MRGVCTSGVKKVWRGAGKKLQRNRNRCASTKLLYPCIVYACVCTRVCHTCMCASAYVSRIVRLRRMVVIWMKEEYWKSLHRLRYRQPVRVIKVSLSESVLRVNKIFTWTEFKVTLEENDMEAARWIQNRDCILSERFPILNLANKTISLENWLRLRKEKNYF